MLPAPKIIHGTVTRYYHTVPSELNLLTVTPERKAIFQYLSRIGDKQFLEFIADILVHVEKHSLIDITNGPGDEKMDILSVDSLGQRHLTQCKHTVNHNENSSGDELDLLFGACMRKACRGALYVTNADLTPQAKRYVLDREYSRGWSGPLESLPDINYWNGARIWQRIATSNVILNKWFSGMAQSHGMRSFFSDVVILKMPAGESCPLRVDDYAQRLSQDFTMKAGSEKGSYDVELDTSCELHIADWFRASDDLGVPFLFSGDPELRGAVPLHAVRAQVSLSDAVTAYNPSAYRDRLASVFGNVLPKIEGDMWWYIVVTGPQAFIFQQDIAKAVLVSIERSEAYVRVEPAKVTTERKWALVPGSEFADVSDPDDLGDVTWRHQTGVILNIYASQKLHPAAGLDLGQDYKRLAARWRTHRFRVIDKADAQAFDILHRLREPDWIVLQTEAGDLVWGYPPSASESSTERIESVLSRRGFTVLEVDEEEREKIVKLIETNPPVVIPEVITGEHGLMTPIDLTTRIFWMSRETKVSPSPSMELQFELLKLKASYEEQYGYDAFRGENNLKISTEELRSILFDPFSFRGTRMLDIGLKGKAVSVHVRFATVGLAAAENLAKAYLNEFNQIEDKVLNLCRRLDGA